MNQFILILQDNAETGELDIAGAQRPEAYDPNSPAHRVGKFIHDNLDQLVALAAGGAQAAAAAATNEAVIAEREKTILLPGNDSLAVSTGVDHAY